MDVKACPFCGKEPKLRANINSKGYMVSCACPKGAIGIAIPIKTWNTRPIEDSLLSKLKVAEEYIKAMEEYDAADVLPEMWGEDQEAYAEDMNRLMRKLISFREAWEKVKQI